MFFKNSRYRKLPDEVTVDSKGRRLLSKSLRSPPEVTGIFFHTIEDGDRLDHLANKYYNQPRKWWRICDANPEFMSPQALLGKTPLITQRFSISFNGAPLDSLKAAIVNQVDGVQEQDVQSDERYLLIVTFNQITSNLTNIIEKLTEIVKTAGLSVGKPQAITQAGKQIIIFPIYLLLLIETVTSQVGVEDVWLTDDESYLIVTFNQVNIQSSNLTDMVEEAGFNVGQPQTIGRTGKQIVIPPDIVG